jgi:hypothetical protein
MKEDKNTSYVNIHCELLGGFGFAVQLLLALVSFGSLVSNLSSKLVKRHLETPKRSLRIWFLVISS